MTLSSSAHSRIITGLVLAAVLIAVWLMGSWPLFLLVAAVAVLGQQELYTMFLPGSEKTLARAGMALGAGLMLLQWLRPELFPGTGLAAAMLLLALGWLFRWDKERALARLPYMATVLGGIVYVPFLLAPALHFSHQEQLLVVAVPALSDVAAYAVGCRFGKRRLWPEVSPKKSVEGGLAGLAAAMITAVGLGLLWGSAPWYLFAPLGLVLGVMAQLGDFFESALKRCAGVKDSGTLLPGHGGVLDRIDSVLFSVAAYALWAAFLPMFGA